MTIRKVSPKEIRQAAGLGGPAGMPAPLGISPVLRASWGFANKWARRFNQELLHDRVAEFLKNLARRFI